MGRIEVGKFAWALFATRFRALLSGAAIAALLCAPIVFAQQTERAKALSMRMMCVCGCNQVLGVCNHVGCTYSHDMLKEIDARIGRNESDDLTIQAFVQEYGAVVMLVPQDKGVNRAMWIVPIVVILAGFFLVREILLRWRRHETVAAPVKVAPELLARARREMGPDE
ncbi:MAG: cytochrome c-type biogenesis protein CcmH [Candidatus Acidiferrales bacterium]